MVADAAEIIINLIFLPLGFFSFNFYSAKGKKIKINVLTYHNSHFDFIYKQTKHPAKLRLEAQNSYRTTWDKLAENPSSALRMQFHYISEPDSRMDYSFSPVSRDTTF